MAESFDVEDKIKKVAEKLPGCYFLSLVGYDGITIAQYIVETKFDSVVFDAEMATLMTSARGVSQDLNLKRQIELIWLTEDIYIITYFIRAEYFLYAALSPRNSNPGLARIELKRLSVEIEKVFYE